MSSPREAGFHPRNGPAWKSPHGGVLAAVDARAGVGFGAHPAATSEATAPRVGTVAVAAAAVGLAALAIALRALFIDRAFDIFTDEITYFTLAKGMVGGSGLDL